MPLVRGRQSGSGSPSVVHPRVTRRWAGVLCLCPTQDGAFSGTSGCRAPCVPAGPRRLDGRVARRLGGASGDGASVAARGRVGRGRSRSRRRAARGGAAAGSGAPGVVRAPHGGATRRRCRDTVGMRRAGEGRTSHPIRAEAVSLRAGAAVAPGAPRRCPNGIPDGPCRCCGAPLPRRERAAPRPPRQEEQAKKSAGEAQRTPPALAKPADRTAAAAPDAPARTDAIEGALDRPGKPGVVRSSGREAGGVDRTPPARPPSDQAPRVMVCGSTESR